ncbi:hypothetical protein, partial [Escherichia coli]|uniref:hypothetical protein n=1 Tax=Escherichia coli TaxID=562 RepID=UPI001386AEB7
YKKIFTGVGVGGSTTANLPSGKFSRLLDNIRAVSSSDQSDPFDVDDDEERPDPHWISASGSNHEALKIGTDPRFAGRIGYLSADFTQPYTTQVGTIAAPRSAALSNEQLRSAGTYVPSHGVSPATQPA